MNQIVAPPSAMESDPYMFYIANELPQKQGKSQTPDGDGDDADDKENTADKEDPPSICDTYDPKVSIDIRV